MLPEFASRHTRVVFGPSGGTATIPGSVTIYGILATWFDVNGFFGTTLVEFTFSNDAITFFDLEVPSQGSVELVGPFLSTADFVMQSSTDIDLVVFHSNVGA